MQPPSVDALARTVEDLGLAPPVALDAARAAISAGDPSSVRERAEAARRRSLTSVVNATGVLLHTNLGRAPLDPPGGEPVRYSNLEFDLDQATRSSRQDKVAPALAGLTGAQATLVVNNGAAALLLVMAALARDKGVAISRGELIEIGGGFRLPEVIAASGARLVEVGTTNRTRRSDYEEAIARAADPARPGAPEIAVVVKVHHSNFAMVGFASQVPVAELAGLGPPLVFDIGSGLLDSRVPWYDGPPPAWLAGEPAARQALAAGAALVTFSTDKLLGGPQAGVVAGRADLVRACSQHPLARALRPGGLVLDELARTLDRYLRRSGSQIPFWKMAYEPVVSLKLRAEEIAAAVEGVSAVETRSVAGGGSVPGGELDSAGVSLAGDHRRCLSSHRPPVVARVESGATVLDLRTVDPRDDEVVIAALRACRRRAAASS